MNGHKYFARIGKPRNYRYFYSQEAYEAFKRHLSSAGKAFKRNFSPSPAEQAVERMGVTSRRRRPTGTAKKIKTKEIRKLELSEEERKIERNKRLKSALDKALPNMAKKSLPAQIPEEISAVDYVFGGKSAKNYKASKKALSKSNKQLKRAQKEANALRKKIEKIESKKSLSFNDKKKLAAYKEQYTKASESVKTASKAAARYQDEYTRAMYVYEATTAIGGIKKKTRRGSVKAKALISRFKNKAVSAIHSPKIRLKKKGK